MLKIITAVDLLLALSISPSIAMPFPSKDLNLNLNEKKDENMNQLIVKKSMQAIPLPKVVGGHTLEMTCMGSNGPTVVLEPGLGCPGSEWAQIANEVSRFTRVCYYNRAGYGESENGPLPRTVAQIVRELHTLLGEAEVPGPYLLVGHSLGGLIARIFEQTYPDDVVGAILIDSPHEYVFESGFYSKEINDKLSKIFLEKSKMEIPAICDQEGSQIETCLTQLREQKQMGNKPFGNKPLVVIQSGKDDTDGLRHYKDEIMKQLTSAEQKEFQYILDNALKMKEAQQNEISLLSNNNRPVVVARESYHHDIPKAQLSLIVNEIKKLAEELSQTDALIPK